MADLQLLTGVCILITGFMSLRCGLSAYHWRIIVDLAWFSSVTHLAGLVVIRNSIRRRPWVKYVRMAVCLVFLVMLIVASIPVGFFDWADPMIGWRNKIPNVYPGSPAICYFDLRLAPTVHDQVWNDWCKHAKCLYEKSAYWKPPPGPNLSFAMHYNICETPTFQGMVFSLILLKLGFWFRFLKIMSWPLQFAFVLSRQRPFTLLRRFKDRISEAANRSDSFESYSDLCYSIFISRPIFAIIVVCQIHIDLFLSIFGEVSPQPLIFFILLQRGY